MASGSYPADAMIVLPCTMGTLARIANGIASHLIERAADVCLKEKCLLADFVFAKLPSNKVHILTCTAPPTLGRPSSPSSRPITINRPA